MDVLLNLQAGAGSECNNDRGDAMAVESEVEDAVWDDECGVPEEQADDATVRVSQMLLTSMESEVNQELRSSSNVRSCGFCPFRKFQCRARLMCHIRRYHISSKQYICSGTKQLKLAVALFDDDQVRGKPGAKYLHRSAQILQESIVPELSSIVTEVDRHIRLVFSETGPTYMNVSALGTSICVRRTRNLYYTKSFADLLHRELVLCHGKCKLRLDSIWMLIVWFIYHF